MSSGSFLNGLKRNGRNGWRNHVVGRNPSRTAFRISIVGRILMIAGAFGFVVSAIVFAVSRNHVGGRRHQLNPQVSDSSGNTSSVHEDSKQRRSTGNSVNDRTRHIQSEQSRDTHTDDEPSSIKSSE